MGSMKDLLGGGEYTAPARAPSPSIRYPDGIAPEVCDLFEKLSVQAAKSVRRYSADAILHRIRWHMQIERGDAEWKCNNNWTAPLARWFMAKHPQFQGFFETRERRSEDET